MNEFLSQNKTTFLILVILITTVYIITTLYATTRILFKNFSKEDFSLRQALWSTLSQSVAQIIFLGIGILINGLAVYYLWVD